MKDNVLIAFIESVDEVLRLKQLNMELLETLEVTMLWFKDYHERTGVPIPHVEVFVSLVKKADRLIDEICSTPPDTTESIRRKFTGGETDEDLTKPL